MKRSWR